MFLMSGYISDSYLVLRNNCLSQIASRFAVLRLVFVLFVLLSQQALTAQIAKDHASAGISLAREGKLADAEHELQQAVQAAPSVAVYRAQLGSILGLEEKWKEALANFQKAVELEPTNISFRRETAAVQWQLGILPSAEKNLKYVLEKQPDDGGSVLLLGLVKEKEGEYETAARLLDSQFNLVITQPDRTVAWFHASTQSKRRVQLAKVNEVFRQRADDPAWARALIQCIQIATNAGDSATAMALFSVIPANGAARTDAGLQLAKDLYGRGQISAAKQLLSQLAEQGAASADLQALLGACFEAEHKPALAREAYQREIDLDPSRIDYYHDLISLLLDLGKTSDAAAVVNHALAVAPNDARPWIWNGHVNLQANAYQDAIDSYSRAGKLDGSNVDAVLGVATVYFILGQNQSAIAQYKKGIAAFPNDARFYIGYAVTLLASPDSPKLRLEATNLLQKAAKLAPRSAEVHYQLGQLALQEAHLQNAEKELLLSVKLEPNQSKAHFALASLYRRMKRTDDAATQFAIYQELKDKEESAKRTLTAGETP